MNANLYIFKYNSALRVRQFHFCQLHVYTFVSFLQAMLLYFAFAPYMNSKYNYYVSCYLLRSPILQFFKNSFCMLVYDNRCLCEGQCHSVIVRFCANSISFTYCFHFSKGICLLS